MDPVDLEGPYNKKLTKLDQPPPRARTVSIRSTHGSSVAFLRHWSILRRLILCLSRPPAGATFAAKKLMHSLSIRVGRTTVLPHFFQLRAVAC